MANLAISGDAEAVVDPVVAELDPIGCAFADVDGAETFHDCHWRDRVSDHVSCVITSIHPLLIVAGPITPTRGNRPEDPGQAPVVLLVGQRRRHLKYLSHKDPASYRELIQKLGLRR